MDALTALWVKAAARLQAEDGQTMTEYSLVLVIVAIGCIVALTALKTGIAGELNKVVNGLA